MWNRKTGRGLGSVALVLGCIGSMVLAMGCGGKGEAPAVAESPGAPSATPPLVDSKGRPVTAGAGATTAAAPSQASLAWDAPESWIAEPPSSSMRRAQYSLPRADGDARDGVCAVFYFGPGQGGDVQANVDRWAGQFAAGPEGPPKAEVSEKMVGDIKVLNVTIAGDYNPSPMMGGGGAPESDTLLLGAIVEGPDAHWFFKCTGPRQTMTQRRGEFDSLIESLRYE